MNTRDIRIAIAEANGREWTMEDHLQSGYHSWQDFADQCGNEVLDDELPNYCNDLNAMHEVENRINAQQEDLYEFWLGEITKTSSLAIRRSFVGERFNLAHATALQRAEAYLRTIGKWKD